MLLELLFAALLTGAVLACLNWQNVVDWMRGNANAQTAFGELIKEQIASGNYRIVAGVFNKHGVRTASREWEAQTIDADLNRQFGGKNRIRVTI